MKNKDRKKFEKLRHDYGNFEDLNKEWTLFNGAKSIIWIIMIIALYLIAKYT